MTDPKPARPRAARGTEDILPNRIQALEHVFGTCRRVLSNAGYGELRTPLFEDTRLFIRSLGEASDVVMKEMFTVRRSEEAAESVTFRPEGTAPAVRAYLQHNLDKIRPFQKFFYMGPMFRFERPQAGRSRQFDQIGIEALGSDSPRLDAEAIALVHDCFAAVGLKNFQVHLNSIGDVADRETFRAVLKEYMAGVLDQRCDDCHNRFERNVFRMLDCKVRECQPTNATAPQFLDHLRPESRERFETTCAALDAIDIPYKRDPAVVRGFDYYTHTVFEVRCPDLGARDAVAGGGRYDNLIESMGGPSLGAVGWALGIAPLMLALQTQKHPAIAEVEAMGAPVFVVPVSDEERDAAFALTHQLRRAGVACDTDFEGKKLKSLFKVATKRGAKLMIVLGPDELAQGQVKIRDLERSEDHEWPADDALPAKLLERLSE